MADEKLESAFSLLLQNSRLSGQLNPSREESERRDQPRLSVDAGDIQVNADPWAILIDLSATGLAYHSDNPHDIGTQVTIGLDDGFSVSAEVVQLKAEEEGSAEGMLGRFRVSCRFADSSKGKELALRIKDLEDRSLVSA